MAINYKKEYEQSDAVRQAQEALKKQDQAKPGAYQSGWQNTLNGIMEKIQNREPFSYDLNGDALYQQYKNQYIHNGNIAMQDTMGKAASMTGGYGNSYAQSVGQQTYQGYLNNLNDRIPELYQLAMERYNNDTNSLYQKYSMLADREAQDYNRYQDALNLWMSERNNAQNRYDTERALDYDRYAADRNFAYQQGRDATSDQQWKDEFEEAIRRFNIQNGITDGGTKGSGGPGGPGESPKYVAPPEPVEPTKDQLIDMYLMLRETNGGMESDAYLRQLISEGVLTNREATELRDSRRKSDDPRDSRRKSEGGSSQREVSGLSGSRLKFNVATR